MSGQDQPECSGSRHPPIITTAHFTAEDPRETRPHVPDSDILISKKDSHWTLEQTLNPINYFHLLHLPHTLSSTNYIAWMAMMESTLTAVRLFAYCLGEVPSPKDDPIAIERWTCTNALVKSILITNMGEEAANQIGYFTKASEIWNEARCMYAGRIPTDWTLTIASIVSSKYNDGDDLLAHLAKMKGFRRDLILMRRNIDDDLFGCFLRISMPQSWDDVFVGLPEKYTSHEIEQRIKDEWRVRSSQVANSISLQATSNEPTRPKFKSSQ